MSMVRAALAPANSSPDASTDHWDRTRSLFDDERAALRELNAHFALRRGAWPDTAREELAPLLKPLRATLDRMGAAYAPHGSTIHIFAMEMHRRDAPYWGWSDDDWLDVLRDSEGAFKARHGGSGNCRQYMVALAYTLCGFDRLERIGRFFQHRLAIKVFGREPVDRAADTVFAEMRKVGFGQRSRIGTSQALYTALLTQRSARLEDLTLDTLRRVASFGPEFIRSGAATLSRTLSRMGLIEQGFDHRVDDRRRSTAERRATDGVPLEWLQWCERWKQRSVNAPSSVPRTYYALLKCGRWLADVHSEVRSPGDWTNDIAFDYVKAVVRMTVGQWSTPTGMYRDRQGEPLKPAAKAANLRYVRTFFNDLQRWKWIPKLVDTATALRLPRAVSTLIGPDPCVIADHTWAKLVSAGLNLTEEDLLDRSARPGWKNQPARYPLTMVRAMAMLWLFAALRRGQIARMPVGCVRWSSMTSDDVSTPACLLHLPAYKTSPAHVRPVEAVVGQAIEAWEQERHAHPAMPDTTMGGLVDYLFVHRGRLVALSYINKSLIPMLCGKAGVPLADARGRITSRRARTTIASQLANAKEPLSQLHLQQLLGHKSPEVVKHYIDVVPSKLVAALERAGYAERNRSLAVLVEQNAARDGTLARDEPWRHYDLGHGLCTHDFFETCEHRLACAKCPFYVPKASSKAQVLEASANLARMLQELPLRDGERAAVEDGLQAMARLAEILRDEATPAGGMPAEVSALRPRLIDDQDRQENSTGARLFEVGGSRNCRPSLPSAPSLAPPRP